MPTRAPPLGRHVGAGPESLKDKRPSPGTWGCFGEYLLGLVEAAGPGLGSPGQGWNGQELWGCEGFGR